MKKKVLILDDEPDILFTVGMMLEQAGYDVVRLSEGKTIMDGSCEVPDIYILDKRMPDMDGLDICRHLRCEDRSREIPIIILSASPKFGPSAMAAGATDFLEKPFQMKIFLEMIARYLAFEQTH